MREMHTLIVRLQDKAAQNQELKIQLEQKDRDLKDLMLDRNRLADENRVSRLSLQGLNMNDDIAGQLSGRAYEESSPARRRREKQEARRREKEINAAPEIEMTKFKSGEAYGSLPQNEFASTPYKHDFDEFEDLQKELGNDTVDGTFVMCQGEGITGEEYFETNPNDTSYELRASNNNTNRDLIDGDYSIPIDMRSPDVTQIQDYELETYALANQEIAKKRKVINPEEKKSDDQLAKVQAELSEYRIRYSKQKERLDHIERLNREHESLYTEFLVRSIKAERDKRNLERRLIRINYIISFSSKIQCSRSCVSSWTDPKQFTWQRGVTILVITVLLGLIICLIVIV